jgi:chemotaxis protein CheD
MLPLSSSDPVKAEKNPCMFGDIGIPLLLRTAYRLGARKELIRVAIAGGAKVFGEENDMFAIGKRNETIARKLFWKNKILIAAENVGGNLPRTLYLEVGSGATWVTSKGERSEL